MRGTRSLDSTMDAKCGAIQRSGLRARKLPQDASIVKEPQSSAHRIKFSKESTGKGGNNGHHHLNTLLSNELLGLDGFFTLKHGALTQYNLKQGLEQYREVAVNAVLMEVKQLHN